jgi:hypothetical protein
MKEMTKDECARAMLNLHHHVKRRNSTNLADRRKIAKLLTNGDAVVDCGIGGGDAS